MQTKKSQDPNNKELNKERNQENLEKSSSWMAAQQQPREPP